MSERFVCIHGHFYQPPRENPWLEEVEVQESAQPYHDWNERVTAECYAPNSASRIMDPNWRIIGLVNNYSKISFNFGPTLLSWLERHNPDVYRSILDADKESITTYSGHGSAIAQVYNHMIMPLANTKDKKTQVRWGIRDFQKRFGRDPEGMWLPEMAVDVESLEVLAENQIKFTLLTPYQALKVRKFGENDWKEVAGGKIDSRQPYTCRLPSGKSVTIFFINMDLGNSLAFGTLLDNGETFAKALVERFPTEEKAAIVSTASDGEVYGHHHPHGDMTLAYCLHYILANNLAKVTNYSEYLANHPPDNEVEIAENTSWSCVHGVERWRSDCGDNTGRPGWKQTWRKPLRNAMDWLRDLLSRGYESAAAEFLKDPWQARNQYIDIVLERSMDNVQRFLSDQSKKALNDDEKRRVFKLLEMQRQAMLMFTSCGWFFDEISGIESTQVLMYAARAMQLANETLSLSLEPEFLRILQEAPSNIQEFGNGARVFEMLVKPATVDLNRVAAQQAMVSLFSEEKELTGQLEKPYGFTIAEEEVVKREKGKTRLTICKLKVKSEITLDSEVVSCVAVWLGDLNVSCIAKSQMPNDLYISFRDAILTTFEKGGANETIVLISKYFGERTYTLKNMFRDDQRRILNFIEEEARQKAEQLYTIVYNDNAGIMQFMNEIRMPRPDTFRAAADIVLNAKIARALASAKLDLEELRRLVLDSQMLAVQLDAVFLGVQASDRIAEEISDLEKSPLDTKRLYYAAKLVKLLCDMPIKLDLWKSQNVAFRMAQDVYQSTKQKTDEDSKAWAAAFESLTDALGIRLG